MNRNIFVSSAILFLAGLLVISSCKKEDNPGEGQVEFSLTMETEQSILKSASISDSTDAVSATSVVITIEDANGESVKNSEKLDLYSMNGSYITQPISLLNGNYKLTRFLVLDSENNVIYASPLEGSDMAYLVEQTLPLGFNAQTDVVTKLAPQVVSVTESTPESFGYTTFSFDAIETFDFLVGAFVYNDVAENYELTSADISIYSNSALVYNGQLSANTGSSQVTEYDSLGVNNKITLPESYDEYTLVISKTGYKTYTKTFAREELKLYYRSIDKGPLVVILEPGDNPVDPVEDTVFYIRGNFGDEYLNFSTKALSSTQSSYRTSCTSVECVNSLDFMAHESTFENDSNRIIELYIIGYNTDVTDNNFDIDNITFPYVLNGSNLEISASIMFAEYECKGCAAQNVYFSTSSNSKITVIIESIVNDVIHGKFYGELGINNGLSMTVTDGEFHGKFHRMTEYHNW